MRTSLPFVLLVAACGGDAGHSGPDARAADAADPPDAPPSVVADAAVDAGAALVSIDVYRLDGILDQGVPILVHDAQGALVNRLAADDLGHAVTHVPAGGQVTAIQGDAGARHLTTITDVQPGDQLTFEARAPGVTPQELRISVRFPAHPQADRYQVASSCGHAQEASSTPGEISVLLTCLDTTARFAAIAIGDDGGVLGYVSDVVPVKANVVLTGDYVPATRLPLTLHRRRPEAGAFLATLPPSRLEALIPAFTLIAPNQRSLDASLVGVGNGTAYLVNEGAVHLYQRFATVPAAAIADLRPAPVLGAAIADGRSVRWSLSAGTGSGDGLVLTLERATPSPVSWSFVLPPRTVSALVPELPADLAALSPVGPGASQPAVSAYDLSWVDGWSAFRQAGHRDAPRASDVVRTRLEDATALVSTGRDR